MKKSFYIIGCGLFGSNLALACIQSSLTDCLVLYDDDIVSISSNVKPPYREYQKGMKKVDALADIIESNDMPCTVITHDTRARTIFCRDNCLVIDCRDEKKYVLKSDIRFSLDGTSFFIDCRKDKLYFDEFSDYISVTDPILVPIAISLATAAIKQDIHMTNKLWFYELQLLIDSKKHIVMKG